MTGNWKITLYLYNYVSKLECSTCLTEAGINLNTVTILGEFMVDKVVEYTLFHFIHTLYSLNAVLHNLTCICTRQN